ncbi:MAG: sodium:solute symporter family protein [Planctomycetota bacterium]|nr:MAG: sodium:solute symporter family protein [Planctomycetota bacterium]
MFGLQWIDIAVILVYFGVVIAIGVWASRRIKNQEDYFLAGRRFGKFIQTFAAFGQGTSADSAVGVTTTTFSNGIAGVWSSLLYLFATPLYWMVMPWMRRLRLITLGDFFEERYGSKMMAGLYAVIGSIGMMTIISVGFAAMAKTVVALTPKSVEQYTVREQAEYAQAITLDKLEARNYDTLTAQETQQLERLRLQKPRKMFFHLNPELLVWIVCIIVLVYAMVGGLEAAFLTDTLQGIFIIILSIVLFPFAFGKINAVFGGSGLMDAMRTMHAQLPQSYMEIFGSPVTQDFTWYYIGALTIMVTINVVIQPNSLIATASAKGEYECRFGFVVGSYMKRFCTVLWGFFALLAVVLYHNKIQNPDLVWGYATLDLLGPLNMGLVGLMIACLMAALMSTADCLMITGSSLITHNIYRPLFPGRPEKHYVFVGRITGAGVVIGGALIATQFDTILQLLKLWWELNVMVAAAFWLGMKWRRATRPAAWCSMLLTMVLFFLLPIFVPMVMPSLRTSDSMLKTTQPREIVRQYVAGQMEVSQRKQEIEQWQIDAVAPEKPEPLTVGQTYAKTFHLPSKPIFWTMGIKADANGEKCGSGTLSLELVLLDKLGVDLQKNSYALNETIRILIRTFTPFIILIVISFLTRRDDKTMLDRFYVKMKTQVHVDPDQDARQMELSYADPSRFDHRKLLPKSDWEFDRWTKTDAIGFGISTAVAVLVVFFLIGLISIGE